MRFFHGKVLAYAPLIESQRGDILLIDFLEKPLNKESLIDLFGEFRHASRKSTIAPAEISTELKRFLAWFNDPPVSLDGALRSGVALFWFLSMSPFEENNEEIAREICELALAQDEKMTTRLYDLPAQLNLHAADYEQVFSNAKKNEGDITEFLMFFLDILFKALNVSQAATAESIANFRYWKTKHDLPLNQRQKKLLAAFTNRSIESVTNKSYVGLFKVSRESAKRDLSELKAFNLINSKSAKGRSVVYKLSY